MSLHARTVLSRIARDQGGFSLVELITVSFLLIVVLSATLMVLERTIEIAPRDQERAHSIREAQVGLDRMSRELREGYAVGTATGTEMDVLVPVAQSEGADKRIRYDCGVQHPNDSRYRRCLRYEGPADFAQPLGSGQLIVDRLLNDAANPVFTRDPAQDPPGYFKAKVEVPSRGERENGFGHKVVLDDALFMRNCRSGC